jgi:hypothetical protein
MWKREKLERDSEAFFASHPPFDIQHHGGGKVYPDPNIPAPVHELPGSAVEERKIWHELATPANSVTRMGVETPWI